MYKIESLAELNQAGVSNAVKLATLSFEQIERLAKFNLNATKSALAGGVRSVGTMGEVKDMQSLLALNAELVAANVDSVLGYSRGVYGIGSEGQSEFSAFADEAWAQYTKQVAAWVEQAGKNAPAGSEAAVNVLKSTFAATTAAFDQVSKATKEVASFIDASAHAAAANAASMAQSAARYSNAA